MFKTFEQLAELLKPFRKSFYLYLFVVVFYEAAQTANSYALPLGIRMLGSHPSFLMWAAFFAGILAFDTAFRFTDHFLDWHIVSKLLYPILKHVNMLIIRVFLAQDSAWHQKNNSGVLVGKAENGKHKVEEMADMLAWEFIPTLTQAVWTMPFLIYFSPLTAAITTASLGLFLLVTAKAEKFRLPLRKKRHDLFENLWQRTEEAVKAHETLTIYGQVQRITSEHESINEEVTALGLAETKTTIFRYHEIRIAINQLTGRAILGILLWQAATSRISIAEVFFIYTLSERLLAAFWRFARMMQRVGECSEGIARLHDLSEQRPEIKDGPETIHDLQIPDQISVEFKDVTFRYPGHKKEALRNVNIIINSGEEIGVVGPSGSGKTTLRRLMLRLYEASSGEILVGGIPIKQWPLQKLRSLFAYVPQGDEVSIFDSDVAYNIRMSRPEATDGEVQEAAKMAGLHQFIASLPEGYQTPVGEKGMKLSGGQKQRLALARAFLSKRKFLILDEATSSVDVLTEREIEQGLRRIASNTTSMVIAHRTSTIRGADRIIVLNNGSKEHEGTHDELMKDPGNLYHTMVTLQGSGQFTA